MTGPYGRIPEVFPELHTPRLRLRACEPADAGRWLARITDPRFILPQSMDFGTSVADAESQIAYFRAAFAAKTELRWALVLDGEQTACGSCGFFDFDARNLRAEVGYGIDPELYGRGLAAEALATVVAYGFDTLGLHRIQATVQAGNAGSVRVLEKCGFAFEGTLRGYKQVRGTPADFTMHAITRADWG